MISKTRTPEEVAAASRLAADVELILAELARAKGVDLEAMATAAVRAAVQLAGQEYTLQAIRAWLEAIQTLLKTHGEGQSGLGKSDELNLNTIPFATVGGSKRISSRPCSSTPRS